MKLLLDEGLPVQLLVPLRLNTGHEFLHVNDLQWKSKGDTFLFPDAAGRGFDGLLALDVDQLTVKKKWKALRKSGLHHVSMRQGSSVAAERASPV
jgi:predicted nuclease of predicted toxin-antitoxin system